MNHYERLKVTQDAPPEVIRAAYRALATKVHPDRQGGNAGPNESAHEQMVALNNSYLVLMDPNERALYDASLRVAQAEADPFPPTQAFEPTQVMGESSRVDVDWPKTVPPMPTPWFREPRWWGAIGLSMLIVLIGAGGWAWEEYRRPRIEAHLGGRDLTVPKAGGNIDEVLLNTTRNAVSAPPPPRQADGTVSPEQLAKMSNDELLTTIPQLLDKPQPGAAAPVDPTAVHPLDGVPLPLKLEPGVGAAR